MARRGPARVGGVQHRGQGGQQVASDLPDAVPVASTADRPERTSSAACDLVRPRGLDTRRATASTTAGWVQDGQSAGCPARGRHPLDVDQPIAPAGRRDQARQPFVAPAERRARVGLRHLGSVPPE